MAKKIVLSLGGSIINPDGINLGFLKDFKEFILRNLNDNIFYIVTGGGRAAREYQQALRDLGETKSANLDRVGIAATRLNAELVRTLLNEVAAPQIFMKPEDMLKVEAKVYVCGGTLPGWSTDYVTMTLAKLLKVDTVINLLDMDHLYTADPKKHPEATPLTDIGFNERQSLVGDFWTPGANLPFDPAAATFATQEKIKIVMMNGLNLDNFEKYLKGDAFVGTKIGWS